jgi:uncharacterized protein (DUF362 family)
MADEAVYINGVSEDLSHILAPSIEDVLLKCSDNLSWLRDGDLVLLKPAVNSPNPYPSTTHPQAIRTLIQVLQDRGAEVVVGDQSGIEHVLHHPGGIVRGNSRTNYIKAGMGTEQDEYFKSFEDEGWDNGFYHYESDKTCSWSHGFYLTRWVERADHIINLPRLSSHSQAGATIGFKNMVGLLREDSRLEFHANGPLNFFIKLAARKSTLRSVDDKSGSFLEKIVEISDALRDKQRLTLTVCTKAQVTFGPDREARKLVKIPLAKSYVVKQDPGLVWGSSDPVAFEAVALALIKDLKKSVPAIQHIYEKLFLFSNLNISRLENMPIKEHPYIHHAMQIGLGKIPSEICYQNVPEDIKIKIEEKF